VENGIVVPKAKAGRQKRASLNCGNSVLPTDEIFHEISRGSG
jgi:hypothetical protein